MTTRARAYHDATVHTVESVRGGGHGLVWSNRPVPFKHYPTVAAVGLPDNVPESDARAVDVLSGRAGAVPDSLARLLFFSAGVTRRRRAGDVTLYFRAYPCAGALYPVEVYVTSRDGVAHYSPVEHALRTLDPTPVDGPPALVVTGLPWRTAWKYRTRGYRHLWWDAGTLLANTLALAPTARLLTGFDDADVTARLGIAPDAPEEYPLVVVPLAGGEPVLAGHAAPHLPVHPLSRHPIEYPAIGATHAAGALDGGDAVSAWRGAAVSFVGSAATALPVEAPAGDGATIEDVILRRGSSRRFTRAPVARDALLWSLAVATAPVPGDFVAPGHTLLDVYVTVHAVDGVTPGAYRYRAGDLELIRPGDFREASEHLCLDQPLGGDSAYTVFLGADLTAVLGALGERGYRAAQLAAGIAGGRLHLAAYTLGAGASGLTFYDRDVSAFYGTTAEPMLAVAVGVPAYRARPGQRPHEMQRLRIELVE